MDDSEGYMEMYRENLTELAHDMVWGDGKLTTEQLTSLVGHFIKHINLNLLEQGTQLAVTIRMAEDGR